MIFETWITFVFAVTILSLIPGPSVLLITGQALSKGLRAAFICLAGETLGGICLILLSLLGVGSLLAASSTLFFTVKWLGVGYLLYLGVRELTEAFQDGQRTVEEYSSGQLYYGSFISGFLTALLNPKAIVFYVAFLSQFINPAKNLLVQYVVITTTSVVMAGIVLAGYALVASQARRFLKNRRARRAVHHTSGGFYVSGSILMGITR